ncbi:hypothetical protein B0H17DRAFT_1207541 [Mycena rosella]|uniref:Uncharacterized protein n=1 Tax=Mycena rosella TaxID=1033263 RepID=A0AAD7D2P3_MYCRO|nr:hypothetical protein B0H17DRAFT_1207541 [Mycena rosella]
MTISFGLTRSRSSCVFVNLTVLTTLAIELAVGIDLDDATLGEMILPMSTGPFNVVRCHDNPPAQLNADNILPQISLTYLSTDYSPILVSAPIPAARFLSNIFSGLAQIWTKPSFC